MTSLTAIFGSSQEQDSEDSEKLLELYWNRAELKKEFANLRDETFQLKDEIKTQQGHTARAQQKLEHIENLLLDPEWVHNVVVFYQLRAMNNHFVGMLARFAEQLKQQREKRQHGRLLEEWNDRRRGEAESIEAKIGEFRMQMQRLEDQLQAERHRFSMMGGFRRFLSKRSIARRLDKIATDIGEARRKESVLQTDLTEVNYREAPDTEGLDVASKRSINLMILSFAQQMYLHFHDDNLAALTKESGDKSVGAVAYGSNSDCEFLLSSINERGTSMEQASFFADILTKRAKLLSETAVFKTDDEAVPDANSVLIVYDIDANGVVNRKDANLLGENYWDIARVLSR